MTERSSQLVGRRGAVPGVAWLPAAAASPPAVVLLGHGGSGHKRADRIVGLARWFAVEGCLAAVAIDAPHHGERIPRPLAAGEYQRLIEAEGVESVIDGLVSDWQGCVVSMGALGVLDPQRVGYVGLSMGTRFGLPLVAASGSAMRCAVLGKFGLRQTAAMPRGLRSDRLRRDAPRVTAPVLFHVQWDDELFPRDGQLELFDLLGSSDKRLVAYPGGHAETSREAIEGWCDFVVRHLGDTSEAASGLASSVSVEP